MKKGYVLVEVLLAMVLFASVVVVIFSSISVTLISTERTKYNADAVALVQEGIEASYSVLLDEWSTCKNAGCHPAVGGFGNWVLVPGPQASLQGQFDRSVTIAAGCRNIDTRELIRRENSLSSCPSGSALDEDIRIIQSTVSWQEQGEQKTLSADLLMMNPEL